MYRILLVDDEPYILDYLFEMLQGKAEFSLDVYKANSCREAKQWLSRHKFDIVMSDIRMPGMSGLELQQEIMANWPKCKVIFLTGHNDFQYIQTATRNGSIDYVLKTEGEESILKAIHTAISQIEAELRDESMMERANRNLSLAVPALRKELLSRLLEGAELSVDSMALQFKSLEVSLQPGLPVLLLYGRVDHWQREMNASDRGLLLYAIQNIAEEYLSASVTLDAIVLEGSEFVWLIQAKTLSDGTRDWTKTVRFVHGTVESIQTSCRELLKLSISVVMGSGAYPWNELPAHYLQQKWLLRQGLGEGEEMILIDSDSTEPDRAEPESRSGVRIKAKLNMLEVYLEGGQRAEFMKLYEESMVASEQAGRKPMNSQCLETFYALTAFTIAYINRWKLQQSVSEFIHMDKLTRLESHLDWGHVTVYFRDLFTYLFDIQSGRTEERTQDLIRTLHQFIRENLQHDLSLVRLAEVVYLSPTYLSKLYKQITGKGLSDYIMEARISTAMELLKDKSLKIHEIAARVGMDSAPYFTRFFKRIVNVSPQEYRDSLANLKYGND